MALGVFATKCVAEFLGTFMLVFTVCCNALSGNRIWGGVSNASVLMASVYALGDISGANFNPAVSFCLGLSNVCHEVNTVVAYMAVQVAAGLLAALCSSLLFWNAATMEPAGASDLLGVGLCEIFYTFMLCFVVLNVAATKSNPSNQFYGLAIGSAIIAGAYGAGKVSAGCFNPAVAIALHAGSPSGLGLAWCLAYAAFEMAGAAAAAGLYRLVRPKEFQRDRGKWLAELVSEFLGTFMLVLTVGLNVLGNSPAAAYSIAACLMCMVYALGDVSGGHFNPAVTLAILASGREQKLTVGKALSYMAVQLLAGVAGAFTYKLIYKGASFDLGPSGGVAWSQVAIAETVFTFILCYVVLCVAISATTQDTTMFGLAIGACVALGGNAIGGLSGGMLNPAVALGVSASHMENVHKAALYSAFELAGGGLAAGVFAVTHAVDRHK